LQGHEVDAGAGRPDRGGRGADRRSGGWLNACRHITGPRSIGCPHDGETLYLDERSVVPQSRYPNGGHRGVLRATEPAPCLADFSCLRTVVREVNCVDREADQAGRLAACGSQGGQQVAQCLLELGDETACHDRAILCVAGLPGEEDQAAAGGGHRVGEAGRAGQFVRVDALDAHLAVISRRPRGSAISCAGDGRARGDRADSAASAADRDRLWAVFAGRGRVDVGRLTGQPAGGSRG